MQSEVRSRTGQVRSGQVRVREPSRVQVVTQITHLWELASFLTVTGKAASVLQMGKCGGSGFASLHLPGTSIAPPFEVVGARKDQSDVYSR